MADPVLARVCEMAISRDEFLRLLPAAVGGQPYGIDGDAFVCGDGGRGWRIRLEALPDRLLGRIRLPRQRVSFEFSGYGAEDMEAFLRRFDLHFARGGG